MFQAVYRRFRQLTDVCHFKEITLNVILVCPPSKHSSGSRAAAEGEARGRRDGKRDIDFSSKEGLSGMCVCLMREPQIPPDAGSQAVEEEAREGEPDRHRAGGGVAEG